MADGIVVGDDDAILLGALSRVRVVRSSGMPLYRQAASAIELALQEHPPHNGGPLPAETDLARAIKVSRPTLRQALSHLAKKGVVYTQRGVGTFLTPPALTRPSRLGSLWEDLQNEGQKPRTSVLLIESVHPDRSTARDLMLDPDREVVHIRRLRFARDRPVAIMDNLLSVDDPAVLSRSTLETGGLYEVLAHGCGIELAMGMQRISARLATAEEGGLLELVQPSAVLITHRLSFDIQGRGIERAETIFVPSTEVAMALYV